MTYLQLKDLESAMMDAEYALAAASDQEPPYWVADGVDTAMAVIQDLVCVLGKAIRREE